MCSIVCNCFCLIHIKRHLSLSFSDPAPDVPGGAEVDRLALFLESGWSDMALFLSKLKSSFWEKKRKEEDSLIFLVYNIYNCTLAVLRTKDIVWPVRSLTSHDGRLHEPANWICHYIERKEKEQKHRTILFFQSNKRGHQICIFAIHSELTH